MKQRLRLAAILAAVLALLPRHATLAGATVNVQALTMILVLAAVAALTAVVAQCQPFQLAWGRT